jgi:predicted amidohydrolase
MRIQDRVLAAAVSRLLAYRARPASIRRAVPQPTRFVHHAATDVLTVAAAQLRFEFVENGAQYAKKIYALAAQAAQQGAQLVAFPEYAWTPLIGMLPNIRDLEHKTRDGLQGAANASGASLRDILLLVAPHVERAFVATGSAVARALNIYLMNGSTIARDANGNLYNVAYLFAPDGSLLGMQKKLHPFTSERAWLTAGSELNVFDIGSTRVAAPVCMDFTYWETTRVAWQRGAEILINPSADDFAEQEFWQARGVRARVQEAPCFGILANMVTDLFGLHWRGPSMIVQPCALGSSVITKTKSSDQEEIVTAALDLEKLRAYRATQHWDFNPTLLHEILPRAYTAATQKRMR